MSERWSSDKPGELRVTISHNFDDYLKCIELMYGERVYFSKVEECLAILCVAAELLAGDCIHKCMQYLEAVRWSSEQESQIRYVLSSLGLKLLPDLAARLDKEDDEHIIFLERVINQMVSLIGRQASGRNRGTAEQYIAGIMEGNTCRDVVEVCGRVLLQEFKSSIDSCSFLAMRSLFKFIEHCEGEILKSAFIAFCEDPEFTKYVKERYKCLKFGDDVFYIVIWFMEALGDGTIIISRASRISFFTTWLPIMGELCSERLRKLPSKAALNVLNELDKAALNVVESLPLVDRKRICVVWAEIYKKYGIDIATPLNLFKDLQDDHYKSSK